MQISNKMMTVGTTLFLAVATGHIMQNEDAIGAKLHQLRLQYTELASALERRTSSGPINVNSAVPQKAEVDRIDPTMARISAVGVKRVAEGVLIAASVDLNSEILPGDESRDEGETTMNFDLGTAETGDIVALNAVTIPK